MRKSELIRLLAEYDEACVKTGESEDKLARALKAFLLFSLNNASDEINFTEFLEYCSSQNLNAQSFFLEENLRKLPALTNLLHAFMDNTLLTVTDHSNFKSFPREIVTYIATYLDKDSLSSIACTSRFFNRITPKPIDQNNWKSKSIQLIKQNSYTYYALYVVADYIQDWKRLYINYAQVPWMWLVTDERDHLAWISGEEKAIAHVLRLDKEANCFNNRVSNYYKASTLHFAIMSQSLEVVKKAITHLNLTSSEVFDTSHLHLAAACGNVEIFNYVLSRSKKIGASHWIFAPDNLTLLESAILSDNAQMLKAVCEFALDKKIDIYKLDKNKIDLLQFAIGNSKMKSVKFLMNCLHFKIKDESFSFSSKVIKTSTIHSHVLIHAFMSNNTSLAKFIANELKQLGVDITKIKGPLQKNILHIAAGNGNLDLMRFALDEGISAVSTYENGCMMGPAIRSGNQKAVEFAAEKLIKLGINLKEARYRLESGYLCNHLQYATHYHNAEAMFFLRKFGLDPNERVGHLQSPIRMLEIGRPMPREEYDKLRDALTRPLDASLDASNENNNASIYSNKQ